MNDRAEQIKSIAAARQREIVERAVELRKESYLSQRQVGEILGLRNHTGISMMESGKITPGLEKMLQILAVYGYTLSVEPIRNSEHR